MASVTIHILSVFLIISILNCEILSVLPDDPSDEYPITCEQDDDCSWSQKCINNLCVDACKDVRCKLHQECVPYPVHNRVCQCYKSYSVGINECIPPCYDDRDCDSTRECKPDKNNFYECSCRPEYAPDPIFPEYECRKRCRDASGCADGSICKKGMCFDFCNSENCKGRHELCLYVNKAYMCLTNESMYNRYGF